MTTASQEDLIDEIAEALVLADAADCDALVGLLAAIDEHLADPPTDEDESVGLELARCRGLVADIVEGRAPDRGAALEQVSERIEALQRSLREQGLRPLAVPSSATPAAGDRPARVDEPPADDVTQVEMAVPADQPGEFVLPEWLDETIFRDFLGAQQMNLDEIEAEILRLEEGEDDVLPALRRRIHTLKGEAGALGMADLERVCHALEDHLARGAGTKVRIDVLLATRDWLAEALDAYSEYQLPSLLDDAHMACLRNGGATSPPPEPPDRPAATLPALPPQAVAIDRDPETLAIIGEFLEEGEEGLAQVDQILLGIEYEGIDQDKVGALFRVFHSIKGVASFLELEAISSLAHTTETLLNKVRGGERALEGPVLDLVFDASREMASLLGFVRRAVETGQEIAPGPEVIVLVERIGAAIQGKAPLAAPIPVVSRKSMLGEILVATRAVAPGAVEAALATQKVTGRRLGEELVAGGAAPAKSVAHALRAQNVANERLRKTRLREMVKVDLDRVDRLVEMIGELVIVEAMIGASPVLAEVLSSGLRRQVSQLSKITRNLQTVATQLRMVPLRGVFQKMSRLVRDVAKKAGKDVRLVLVGEAIEMDRSMVEQISDPLVHLLRNAVDHGIEPAAERAVVGKPVPAELRLAATHEGSNVVIEIRDDGRGLSYEKIVRRAVEKGLVGEHEKLTTQDIHDLIFAPGFSTADAVTELSGRGVGMDVVKMNIEEGLRGRISLSSVPGEGTTVRLILPLTLVIMDGMLVSCGSEQYVIPTAAIVEAIAPERTSLRTYLDHHELIEVRGEVLPLLRLGRLLEIPDAETDPTRALVIVVESMGRRLGLMVDEVLIQQQVVKKSVGSTLQDVAFVAGATILSDGRVGLILNIDELVDLLPGSRRRRTFG